MIFLCWVYLDMNILLIQQSKGLSHTHTHTLTEENKQGWVCVNTFMSVIFQAAMAAAAVTPGVPPRCQEVSDIFLLTRQFIAQPVQNLFLFTFVVFL